MPNPPVPAPIQIIGAPGRVQVIGATVGFNGGAIGNQIVVTDGKPKALPTDASGAIRVRTMEKPEVFGPADDKLILLGLELTPEPKMHVQQILNVKVDKALDDKGQELVQSVVPANPNVPVPLPAARPVPAIGRGRLIFGFTNTTPVYLKKGEKPSKSLKEFSGVVSAQILAPATAAITADKIITMMVVLRARLISVSSAWKLFRCASTVMLKSKPQWQVWRDVQTVASFLPTDNYAISREKLISELALRHRLPSISGNKIELR